VSDKRKLAEIEPIAQTGTDSELRWKAGFSLDGLQRKEIRPQLELRRSRFYSFGFADRVGP